MASTPLNPLRTIDRPATDHHGGSLYALFPTEDRLNAGALVKTEGHRPSTDGPLGLPGRGPGERVSVSGGKIIMDKTFLPTEAGHVGLFVDSEGNRVGLQHL